MLPDLTKEFNDFWHENDSISHRKFLLEEVEKFFPYESVLDLGCGTGKDLWLISKIHPGVKLKGLTLWDDFDKAYSYIEQADIEECLSEIPDKSFGVVISDGTLIYTPSYPMIVRHARRIARKGVLLMEYDLDEGKLPSPLKKIKITEQIWPSSDKWPQSGYIYIWQL